jgi:hypothetical protein
MAAPVKLCYRISVLTMGTAAAPIFVTVDWAMLGLIVKILPQAMQQPNPFSLKPECCFQLAWE